MNLTLGHLKQELTHRLNPITASETQTSAEIRLIIEALLHLPWESLYRNPEQVLSQHQWEQVETLLQKRIQHRIPIQYLLGEADFYGLRFHVSPGVLIPRPETELLVEHVLEQCKAKGCQTILDIGTGSGAIAISLAKHLSGNVQVSATDISSAALGIASENARRMNVTVKFYQGDLLAPVSGQSFDLIVSNPPYITPQLRSSLLPEVRDHEPVEALFAEQEGLAFYHRIAQSAPQVLTPGGTLAVEVGHGMAETVQQLFEAQGFQTTAIISDYAGIPRHLSWQWA